MRSSLALLAVSLWAATAWGQGVIAEGFGVTSSAMRYRMYSAPSCFAPPYNEAASCCEDIDPCCEDVWAGYCVGKHCRRARSCQGACPTYCGDGGLPATAPCVPLPMSDVVELGEPTFMPPTLEAAPSLPEAGILPPGPAAAPQPLPAVEQNAPAAPTPAVPAAPAAPQPDTGALLRLPPTQGNSAWARF